MPCVWCSALAILFLQAVSGIDWPAGKYALLKPTTGCPDGWQGKGWLLQDTEDTNPRNNRSEILNIDGYVSPSYVMRSFCVKTITGTGSNWPKGKYCMYQKYNEGVASGMSVGQIKMENEKSSNKDKMIYVSAYTWIKYWSNRRYLILYFQCQTSGSTKVPIKLPITKPFYLLPYGSRDCQQVKWMVATTEWIKYDLNNPGVITFWGTKPFFSITKDNKNNKDITMYYCYYRSCNHTLTEMKGVFESPGFPGKYPDGQFCSWRIMVPANHTIHVQFTNFSLFENGKKDYLTYAKNVGSSFYLNETFYGYKQPFTVTANSDVLFQFLTNEEGNSTGFRAEYTISLEKSESTRAPPTTGSFRSSTTLNTNTMTGGLDATTVPTTKSKNQPNNSSTNTFKKSRVGECDGAETTLIAILIPLICLVVVFVIIIGFYRWRSKQTKCEKCASSRCTNEDAVNPTYDIGQIPISQRISTVTMNTLLGADEKDGRIYQSLSRDQQPEYESPDYPKQNGTADPYTDPGCPEYHELEPMDNNVPDVVYDVLEGPDPDNRPSDDQTYQALNQQTTHNPLYQSANPATMVTHNRLYVDSVA